MGGRSMLTPFPTLRFASRIVDIPPTPTISECVNLGQSPGNCDARYVSCSLQVL
jgi:hypothetical protein